MSRSVDRGQLDAWLARLGGPRYKGSNDRDEAVAEMRAAGADALFPLLLPMLSANGEARCTACEAIMWVDPQRGLPMVLPLLQNPDEAVRLCACEEIGWRGGPAAVPALLAVLRSDEDAQVRVAAAFFLGRNGGPGAIPALLAAMESDHEVDILGFSPSHTAAMALDEILGTDETCLHFGKLRRMLDREPDLERLRSLAEERYRQWQREQPEQETATDGSGI
jgi:hypothetical protein